MWGGRCLFFLFFIFFGTLSETGTRNNGIFPSITPGLQSLEEGLLRLVWVNKFRGQREKEGMINEGEGACGEPVSPLRVKTSVRGIWSEDWRLFYLRLFFFIYIKYVRIRGRRGKDVRGRTTETLLTNQKAEVKVLFL